MMDTTELWKDYQNGLKYQSASGLAKDLPTFVRFYEGKQWAAPTKNTKNMPRPVINIVKMICRNKKSAILSTPVRIVYKGERVDDDSERFNRFADYIQKELGQEELDKRAIQDAVVKGTYIYHYYWDAEAKGKDGVKEGGLRCEIIDPLRVFFSDPTQQDEQKQKWIIITSREEVSSVQAKADADADVDAIKEDSDDNNKYGTVEQDESKLVTVLTRYFRNNGEVYCEKATKSCVVNKPFPIAPDVDAALRTLDGEIEDAPNNSTPDDDGKELTDEFVKANLYPIVVGNYEFRENSIYGLGEVEGLIPNQKAINFNVAMSLLNAQEIAWGKYIALPGALRGQTITNEPGQVITDYSNTGNGIRKMTEQAMQTQPLTLVQTITDLTRSVTGATQVMTGETIGANMSGAAIAQLQSQAQQPIVELRDMFWISKTKQGRVMAQFYKLFYEGKEFIYPMDTMDSKNEYGRDIFFGSMYQGREYDVAVEAMSGTQASAAGDINALDTLFAKGAIDLRTYVNAYPEDALSNKSELLKGIEMSEQSQIAIMSQQMEQAQNAIKQLESQLAQSTEVVAKQQEVVDQVVSVIQENSRLKAMIANLYTEGSQKINQANAIINSTTQDARDFAQVIAGGINGNQQLSKMQTGSNYDEQRKQVLPQS